MTAIHSPNDRAYTLERTRVVLAGFYDPNLDEMTKALLIEDYATALQAFPRWAVAGAYDDWVSTGRRRPSAGEIVILAQRRVKPFNDEIRYRKAQQAPALPPPDRNPANAEEATRIMYQAGYTPKKIEAVQRRRMATSEAELFAEKDEVDRPHWTESADPDGKDMDDLRRARNENPLIQAARRAQYEATGIGQPDQSSGPDDYTPPEYADEAENG